MSGEFPNIWNLNTFLSDLWVNENSQNKIKGILSNKNENKIHKFMHIYLYLWVCL